MYDQLFALSVYSTDQPTWGDSSSAPNASSLTTTTERPMECPSAYPTFMRVMYVYLLPPLLLLGVVGNALAVVVFWVQRRERLGERTELLSGLAVVDSFYLLTNIFSRFLPTLAKYHNIPALFWSIYFRPTAYAFASTGQMMACYTLVLVTAHRYALICHPLKVSQWTSTTRTVVVFTVTTAFCIAYNIPRLFELSVRVRFNSCLGAYFPTLGRSEMGDNLIYSIVYLNVFRLVFRHLIPIGLQFALTLALTRGLRSRPGATLTRRRTMTLAHVLAVVAVVFLICQIPPFFSAALNSAKRTFKLKVLALNDFHNYFVVVCNMLLTLNSATNFIIYILCGSEFKRTLRQICPLCACQGACPQCACHCREKSYVVDETESSQI